jgi:hypothetical protein
MNITIAVEMTLAQRMRNTRHRMRWFGWLLRLFGAGCLVFGTTPPYDIGLLVLGVVYLLGPELLGVLMQVRAKRYGRTYTYTLTEDRITVKTAISHLELSWEAVRSVRRNASSWIIRVPGGGFSLPKDLFTAEQVAEWQSFLAGRGLVAA